MTRSIRAALLAGLLAAGCMACDAGAPSGVDQHELLPLVCSADDLPPRFYLQNDGTFVAANLADLADDADAELERLDQLGAIGGYFTLWSESLERPPFEPATSVLCQALAFESSEGAAAFVFAIEPQGDTLASVGLASLPGTQREAEEERPPAGLSPGARAFRIVGEEGDVAVEVYLVVFPAGANVVAVYVGSEDQEPTLAEAMRLARLIAGRATALE